MKQFIYLLVLLPLTATAAWFGARMAVLEGRPTTTNIESSSTPNSSNARSRNEALFLGEVRRGTTETSEALSNGAYNSQGSSATEVLEQEAQLSAESKLELGHQVCSALTSGATRQEIENNYTGATFGESVVNAQIRHAAVQYLCPEHQAIFN